MAADRVRVLLETLEALGTPEIRARHHEQAKKNLQSWAREVALASSAVAEAETAASGRQSKVVVLRGDWGVVTAEFTRQHGNIFAVLNMANAEIAGGGYTHGAPAQEENMFRRTDCHYTVVAKSSFDGQETNGAFTEYTQEMTDLLNAEGGRVLLDVERPRVCIRDAEDLAAKGWGYRWLAQDEVFPFYELRAAAVDLRGLGRKAFSREETLRRVTAQLETLIAHGIRHAVLSAFGCGAFMNPPDEVAACYREALQPRLHHFDCVAFAIFYPGYGDDNFPPFERELHGLE